MKQANIEAERRICFSTQHKIIFFAVSLFFVLLAGILSYTYRPYVYSHHIFDFHLADCVPNLCAVPACVFLYLALVKRIDHRPHYYILCACFGFIIYEILFSLSFDQFDVLATLISSIITYFIVWYIFSRGTKANNTDGR